MAGAAVPDCQVDIQVDVLARVLNGHGGMVATAIRTIVAEPGDGPVDGEHLRSEA